MNKEELKTLDQFVSTVNRLAALNEQHRAKIDQDVARISALVNVKHLPVNLEQEVLRAAQSAIGDSIKSALAGYNSPLLKLVSSVVDENSAFLRQIISDAFTLVIKTEDFKQSIVAAFSHKVARTIISNGDGLFDKVANELKQDATFKAKMTVAIANVVNECLASRQS